MMLSRKAKIISLFYKLSFNSFFVSFIPPFLVNFMYLCPRLKRHKAVSARGVWFACLPDICFMRMHA